MKKSSYLVDPDLAPALALLPSLSLNDQTVPVIRAAREQQLRVQQAARAPVADIEVREAWVPGPAGAPDVRVLMFRPKSAQGLLPAYLHLHGGGFVLGKPEMYAEFCELFARDANCLVVSVDYRLAPETRFPGAIEDCHAALLWLHEQADALGVDRTRIAVGGESAGATLAAALALMARDRGSVPLVLQLLIYPALTDRLSTQPEENPYAGEYVWTRDNHRYAWTALLGHEPDGRPVSPYAAPARAENLSGLPPAFISVGALDLFVDEDIAYATRLLHAGVATELHVYPGAVHAFELIREARVTQAALRDRIAALRRALHQPSIAP